MRYLYLICFFLFFSTKSDSQQVSDFVLPDVEGNQVSFSNYKNAKGFAVIFTCNHCPFAQFYHDRINRLNEKYKKRGVYVIAINPMDTLVYEEENIQKMKEMASVNNFNFPYLLDASQKVAGNFNAVRTPQAFLVWKVKSKFIIRYSGAIDDNGAEPEKIQHKYLEDAICSQLKGKKIKEPVTISVGCKINYRK